MKHQSLFLLVIIKNSTGDVQGCDKQELILGIIIYTSYYSNEQ